LAYFTYTKIFIRFTITIVINPVALLRMWYSWQGITYCLTTIATYHHTMGKTSTGS